MGKMDLKNIIALIAGILCIIQGVLNIITPSWGGLLFGVLAIIVGLIILMASGFITDKLGIPLNLITSIIFCILCFVFASWWGGILMVIVIILFVLGK